MKSLVIAAVAVVVLGLAARAVSGVLADDTRGARKKG